MPKKLYKVEFENVNGFIVGDIFWLNYYDLNIFLYVCKADINKVLVYELQTQKIKKGKKYIEIIKPGLKMAKKSLLRDISEDKKFWVDTEPKAILVPVRYMCPIYKTVIESGINSFPKMGLVKAIYLKEEKENGISNYYWEVSNDLTKKRNVVNSNINKVKNIA